LAARKRIAKKSKPKTVLRLPDLEQSKNAVLNSLPAASSQNRMAMRLTSSSVGVARSLGWPSTKPLCSDTERIVGHPSKGPSSFLTGLDSDLVVDG